MTSKDGHAWIAPRFGGIAIIYPYVNLNYGVLGVKLPLDIEI